MAHRVEFLTKELTSKYVILDKKKFEEKAQALALGLSAMALQYWVDTVKARYSTATAAKYVDSIYWDPSNVSSIKISVVQNTLASLLEGGREGPIDLRKSFLKKAKIGKTGTRYRRVPIIPSEEDRYIGKQVTAFDVSTESIMSSVDNNGGLRTSAVIKSKLNPFEIANVPAKSFQDTSASAASMVGANFRTVSDNTEIRSPKDTWMHPGIQAALIAGQTADYMRTNRDIFLQKLFEK